MNDETEHKLVDFKVKKLLWLENPRIRIPVGILSGVVLGLLCWLCWECMMAKGKFDQMDVLSGIMFACGLHILGFVWMLIPKQTFKLMYKLGEKTMDEVAPEHRVWWAFKVAILGLLIASHAIILIMLVVGGIVYLVA